MYYIRHVFARCYGFKVNEWKVQSTTFTVQRFETPDVQCLHQGSSVFISVIYSKDDAAICHQDEDTLVVENQGKRDRY